ncbi:DUF881 domain-containing protein [Nocardioides sp. zg-1308]|uniref:DUF881 domain-containing protein n=1 Tax=Nocardioides renjunii TaxID=3095075 RepID=A0ABU5KAY3_9ACTN|nr:MULTISPECIES: DUF881 domain-containing protein [unclassified Nocardioides]MDZ5662127.1 DUF881 domain-containing protein [Nocardioides sp. S-58]NPD06164.1 DUF881 domain-containing protein [Nocardioides sp. zg-1308]WQQ24365.1 DUF881 domain-containing protein [Nocardioides sp. S-34]
MPEQDPTTQEPATEESPGRERMRDALMRPSGRQAVVGVLLAVLGFAFVVQVRDTNSNDTYAGLRESELIQVLDGLTGTAERARREVDRLEARRDELRDENQARSAALDEAEQRLRTLNVIAGLVPVSGQGLRVTIGESETRVSVGSLLDTIQELRTAGAEAMEFNDSIRLGADSSFEDGVGGIELDGELLEPPYVLDVIGDPHILRTALTFSTGPVETLETLDGATVTIEELETVEITSVREASRPEYAEFGTGQ